MAGTPSASSSSSSSSSRRRDPYWFMYVAGGLGEMAACVFSHPLDVVKVRCQLKGELSGAKVPAGLANVFRTLSSIARAEGVSHFGRSGLYYGLSASLGRQAVFSTLRHGTYNIARDQRPDMNLLQQIVVASCIGGVSAFVANPCDVILVRMQADGHWPEGSRRGYSGLFDGLRSTAAEEGIVTLWRGCTPTVLRACLVTAAQLPSYGLAKSWLLSSGHFADSTGTHFLASTCSGLVATVVTCPVDVVKTRIMNMQKSIAGAAIYTSPLDCVWQTVRTEGPLGLYKGFGPTFVRQTPHTILLWMFQEQILRFLRDRRTAEQV